MKADDKDLLLKDLYTRLPYRIKFKADNEEYIREIHYIKDENVYISEYQNLPYWIDTIKPYLRPMSSMTEEEIEEFSVLGVGIHLFKGPLIPSYDTLDWLNKHMLDYRGLIEKGLALEAPEGMYKYLI